MKKKCFSIVTAFCFSLATSLSANTSSTYIDYQNYNHGYCPSCNCYPCMCSPQQPAVPPPPGSPPLPPAPGASVPCGALPHTPGPCPTCAPPGPCDPCAPVCGADCGISICAIAVAVIAVAAAAAIIVASGDGSSTTH